MIADFCDRCRLCGGWVPTRRERARARARPLSLLALFATSSRIGLCSHQIIMSLPTSYDLTGSTDEDEPPQPQSKKSKVEPGSSAAGSSSGTSTGGHVERVNLPGGVLDETILHRVDAICQQNNCVGCDGRGLAEGIAKLLPYGCPYADRRPEPPANKFAVLADRATPGSIQVRKAPAAVFGVARRPDVICMFAQFEMGGPDKYKRVKPMPPSDGRAAREQWFGQCLREIGKLSPPPKAIAFPHEIGCGLAGGEWPNYEAMLQEFAAANPHIHVIIARWTGGKGSGSGGKGGKGGKGSRGKGGGGTSGRGSASNACFRCGQVGHWASACKS